MPTTFDRSPPTHITDNTAVNRPANNTSSVAPPQLNVFAYDGSNTYTSEGSKAGRNSTGPLMIYRSPQARANVADQKPYRGRDRLNSKEIFDRMYNDPNVQFAGQETWKDGRTVYVLQSRQQIKVMDKDKMERPTGLVTVYFDVKTYEMLANQVTMEKDGKELLISSQKILADEILPAGTSVAWELSDLPGVAIVDDAHGEHGIAEELEPVSRP